MSHSASASAATIRSPWVLVSAGFHDLAGQAKPNASLADFLLERGTPVHLVGHDFAPRFLNRPRCAIHRVSRPAGVALLGEFVLRAHGKKVARAISTADPASRVVVNGGCCSWADINWIHFVHAAWRPSRSGMPPLARLKDCVASAIFRKQEREAIRSARLVIADSELTRRHAIECLGVEPSRAKTIYYGSEPGWQPSDPAERTAARDWLGIAEGRPLAVFVGGFGYDERKGFDTLWRAWQDRNERGNWDVDLVAAGGGRTLEPWRQRVQRAGLADRVRLIGFTDRVYDLLAAADVLVSPVRYEPYGLNVQEAICRGVPALVSRAAGVAEQYPDELGEMILPVADDWADLSSRLGQWRERIDFWRAKFRPLGEKLRSRSWSAMAEQFVTLAEERRN